MEFVCNCQICVTTRRYFSIIEQLPEADKKWMEMFYDQYGNEMMDANVNQAILDGSWPSAIGQLEEALTKAKRERNGKEQ